MELPKPDLMQKDKEKQGRGKGERTVTVFFRICGVWVRISLHVSSLFSVQFALFQHTWNETYLFQHRLFAMFLSKMKHFLESDLCLLPYIICKSKGSQGSSVSEKDRAHFSRPSSLCRAWLMDLCVPQEHSAVLPLWVQKSACISQELHPDQ